MARKRGWFLWREPAPHPCRPDNRPAPVLDNARARLCRHPPPARHDATEGPMIPESPAPGTVAALLLAIARTVADLLLVALSALVDTTRRRP